MTADVCRCGEEPPKGLGDEPILSIISLCFLLPGAEEALLRWDLPAGEGLPDVTATADPEGSQAGLRCLRGRGQEVHRRRPLTGGVQGQRDILRLLQSRRRGRQTAEGGPEAGRAVGLPAPPPREDPQQRSPPHAAQVPAVGRSPPTPPLCRPTTLHRCVKIQQKGNISQGYSILISPKSAVTNENKGRLLFWIRACRQNALYCACCILFILIYFLFSIIISVWFLLSPPPHFIFLFTSCRPASRNRRHWNWLILFEWPCAIRLVNGALLEAPPPHPPSGWWESVHTTDSTLFGS